MNAQPSWEWPIDLRTYRLVKKAAELEPGDVIVYLGDSRRRWLYQTEAHWILRVTRIEGRDVYGQDVFPRDLWREGEEFVVVSGQIEHHGVTLLAERSAEGASTASEGSCGVSGEPT